jgi:L-seryl-tRNA(Ser) seleniumtransferase
MPDRPPSVHALARSLADLSLPHPLLVEAARQALAAGAPGTARERAQALSASLLQPVINATGVLLHTNLGRAPLEHHQGAGYSNLELDLATGRRGSRGGHAGALLARAAGAEAALVVNNGAAAVLLVLAALAAGQRVLVSRGELVEIGGGFRIPEVMAASGAELVEVGTTNRTRLADYARALGPGGPGAGTAESSPDPPAGQKRPAALVLKVHQSNYRMVGFTEDVGVAALAGLGPPVVFDVGSGLLDAGVPWLEGPPPPWLAGEPAVRQALAAGAALVTFSGDKLLGGPQAGVIAGRADLVAACARHPLARALRPGGLVLGALQEVALAYLDRRGGDIPFWRMAAVPAEELRLRAEDLAGRVRTRLPGASVPVVGCASVPGGGSLPGIEIPSYGISLPGDLTVALRRAGPVPVIARVEGARTVADLRAVAESEVEPLVEAVVGALGTGGPCT